MNKADQYARTGLFFQLPMMLAFIAIIVTCRRNFPIYHPVNLIELMGVGLFVSCLYRLYVLKGRKNGLITNFPFSLTRHPMYTGLFLMSLQSWWSTPRGVPFYAFETVFLVGMIVAGYFQEKETLARFGRLAEDYYKRTPRLIFMYPFKKR